MPERLMDSRVNAVRERSSTAHGACAKEKQRKNSCRLPAFDCPACGAKRILFAGDKVSKNETVLETLQEADRADYVLLCPKCRQYIGVHRLPQPLQRTLLSTT